MSRSIMITGGLGFIGSNFAHYWKQKNPDDLILVYDAMTYSGNRKNLDPLEGAENFFFVQGDICNFDKVLATIQDYKVNTIIHFAAESHVDKSISGPDVFVQTNLVGTHTLLSAATRCWLTGSGQEHRFHHISTDEVFGSLKIEEPAFHELRQYEPNSPYSASKAGSDHLVRAYFKTYGLQVSTSNCSNNYGPYQHPEKLIPQTITNILLGNPIGVYGDGRNIRDWLYVEDHCRGVDRIIEGGEVGETYNIGGNCERENIHIVEFLCDELQSRFECSDILPRQFPKSPAAQGKLNRDLITKVADRPGHDRRYAINATKIKEGLGFLPIETFESGIGRTISWYLERENWWRELT